DRVDVAIQQLVNIGHGRAAQGARDEFSLLAVRIGDADQLGTRQSSEYTSMIAAHYADAHDTHTQRTLRAGYCGLHHFNGIPTPISSALLSPSMAFCAWRPPLGNQSEHVLLHFVTARLTTTWLRLNSGQLKKAPGRAFHRSHKATFALMVGD